MMTKARKRTCGFQIFFDLAQLLYIYLYKLEGWCIKFLLLFCFSDESEMNLMMNGTGEGIGKIQLNLAHSNSLFEFHLFQT